MNYVKKIAYKPAIKFGFSKLRSHFGEFLKITLYMIALFFAAIAITGLIAYLLNREAVDAAPVIGEKLQAALLQYNMIPAWIAFFIFYFLLFYLVAYQQTRLSLLIHENRLNEWHGFFDFNTSRFFTFFWALSWLMVKMVLGLICFVIPAYYIMIKYWFTGISIVDGRTATVGEDVLYNRDLTRGSLWNVLGFIFALLLSLWLLLIIVLLVGGVIALITMLTTRNPTLVPIILQVLNQILVLFIMPMMFLARTHAYKQLENFVDTQRNETSSSQL